MRKTHCSRYTFTGDGEEAEFAPGMMAFSSSLQSSLDAGMSSTALPILRPFCAALTHMVSSCHEATNISIPFLIFRTYRIVLGSSPRLLTALMPPARSTFPHSRLSRIRSQGEGTGSGVRTNSACLIRLRFFPFRPRPSSVASMFSARLRISHKLAEGRGLLGGSTAVACLGLDSTEEEIHVPCCLGP